MVHLDLHFHKKSSIGLRNDPMGLKPSWITPFLTSFCSPSETDYSVYGFVSTCSSVPPTPTQKDEEWHILPHGKWYQNHGIVMELPSFGLILGSWGKFLQYVRVLHSKTCLKEFIFSRKNLEILVKITKFKVNLAQLHWRITQLSQDKNGCALHF